MSCWPRIRGSPFLQATDRRMNSNVARLFRIPSLFLAAALQMLPIVRVALPAAEGAAGALAIVFRWAAAAAAMLGGVQAVSGASTVITSALSAGGVQGQSFTLRLTTAPNQAQYWTATGLPAGLGLTGNNGSSLWNIAGTPTVSGTFTVGLTAYEHQGSSLFTSATLTLTISPGTSPPSITGLTGSQTVMQGQSATFTVAAAGTAPLNYQWQFQSANLGGQTSSNLLINPVTTNNAGNYDVIVGNAYGSVTSAVTALTVTVPRAPAIVTPPASQSVTQGQGATFTVDCERHGSAELSVAVQERQSDGPNRFEPGPLCRHHEQCGRLRCDRQQQRGQRDERRGHADRGRARQRAADSLPTRQPDRGAEPGSELFRCGQRHVAVELSMAISGRQPGRADQFKSARQPGQDE